MIKKSTQRVVDETKLLDDGLVVAILNHLTIEAEGGPSPLATFLGIAQALHLDVSRTAVRRKLLLHLRVLDEEGYIEERHFHDPWGFVDYDIEARGIDFLRHLAE